MNIPDLLTRLEGEGLTVSLKVRLETADNTEPTPEALELVRTHREDLITYLAGGNGLQLHGFLLYNLMRWIGQHHELRLEHPAGLTLCATPEVAVRLLNTSAWAVLYTPERDVLVTVGNVPVPFLETNNRLAEVN